MSAPFYKPGSKIKAWPAFTTLDQSKPSLQSVYKPLKWPGTGHATNHATKTLYELNRHKLVARPLETPDEISPSDMRRIQEEAKKFILAELVREFRRMGLKVT